MRIVMNRYAEGDKFAVETATDGSVPLRDLLGKRRIGARISSYTEVACDDIEKGLERLLESLEYLTDEIRKRLDETRQRQSQPAT